MKLEEMMRRLQGADERRRAARSGQEEEQMSSMSESMSRPAALAAIPESKLVQLDVREDLRNGQEPFSRIMAARQQIPEGGGLVLRAIFEPVPLYGVLAKQGFAHWTEQLAGDDWRIWFYPASAAAPVESTRSAGAAGNDEGDVRVLDVRDLEPPEPMLRTLAALEVLPAGGTLVQINSRVPQFLLPQLAERGFTYEIREQEPGLVRLFIRRADQQTTNDTRDES